MTNRIREFAKKIIFRHTIFGKPKYRYCVEPIQLAEIVKGIDDVIVIGGKTCIIEVGVARGLTSRFIAEHIEKQGYEVDYYCLDTFSSFTHSDLSYEIKKRGKRQSELMGFAYNDYKVWKNNFKEFSFVKPIKCDCSDFDFSTLAPIHLCFLDVDLYIPTQNVLNHIYEHMANNSLIIVDDILNKCRWDGAYQAFMEFVDARKLEYRIIGNKCGIIRKT